MDVLTDALQTLAINDNSKQCCKDAFKKLEENVIKYVTQIATDRIDAFLKSKSSSISAQSDNTGDVAPTPTTTASDKILTIEESISDLTQKAKQLQVSLDEQVARNMTIETQSNVNAQKIDKVEKTCEKLGTGQDSIEQQGRKETVEFHGIPFQFDEHGREDTDLIVVEFCRKYLDIKIKRSDISISHRQIHPDEKRKQGDQYVPSIYCKFVNRSTARLCIKRRYLIKDLKYRGNSIFLRENLTLSRRMLWERVQRELPHFQQKWVKNGKIFVRKYRQSFTTTILCEKDLNLLIEKQQRSVKSNRINSERKLDDRIAPSRRVQTTPILRIPLSHTNTTFISNRETASTSAPSDVENEAL